MATRRTAAQGEVRSPADAVDTQLERYRSMRDFGVTAEPAGGTLAVASAGLPFVIQKHAASHLHYDFRLGWNGVLKSWACAKGPSYVVKDRRLAVQVEDHPMEYGGFEGIIPAGQYGGGTVMVWDQGTWAPQAGYEDVGAGLRDGHLKFTLDGSKMHGKWALIRMGGKAAQEKKPNWLLIKEHDEHERAADQPSITEEAPNSAVTGRSLEQIASSEDHVWNSKQTQAASRSGGQAWTRKSAAAPAIAGLDALPKELQPSFVEPQLAEEAETPPNGAEWVHELKLDGYRIQARKQGDSVQLLTRSGLDWTARVPAIAEAVRKLAAESVTLDGEVVVLAEDGTTNFADLQASFQEGARNPLTYFLFDLLHLEGRNPRTLSLLQRKQMLAAVLEGQSDGTLQMSEHLVTSGEVMFRKACELHAEGIVSKRADQPYRSGRSRWWMKSKCLHEQEFVIGGYTLPGKGKAGGPGLGALLLGYYAADGKTLTYAGRTGTGFTQRYARELRQQLEGLRQEQVPFAKVATEARRGALWVQPMLVAQVRFATWTADDQLRQAAFLGLREDKPATEVRRELAAPTPKGSRRASPPAKAASAIQAAALAHAPVRLTHPEKVLDPSTGLTKQQLADFYWAVAERMLPHLAGRALSLVRLPDGIGKQSFYQKHVTSTLPPGFDSVEVPDLKKGTIEHYVGLSTVEAIASLAQMSVLEVHPWGSLATTRQTLEHPDRLTIDLDPDESLSWTTLTEAAEDVRRRFKALDLESWVKTTGGKGLHVVVPIAPGLGWVEIKQFAHGFVSRMERDQPALYLTKMTKAARSGRIYLDYLRNERGATAVAPYSPRARAGTAVAMPLAWAELKAATRPDYRIGNFGEWAERLNKDPWAKLSTTQQMISLEAQKACGLKRDS